ncbi:MAG: site-specific DNA-methyltransferase [Pseudomonadota bacterium]|nr:site-specific DNA-methyltransferase [Pseudomonadota bacterium]
MRLADTDPQHPAYEVVPIASLTAARRNARTHSEQQLAALVASLRQFGMIAPIAVDIDSRIVAGHGRWEAAKRLGLASVPIVRAGHLSSDELRLYAIADNRIAEQADWDRGLLAIEFSELEIALPDISLSVSGFELPEIDLMTGSIDQTSWSDLDEQPEPADKVPVSRSGDLWLFGDKHRLVCGSSIDAGAVAILLEGDSVALVATDPPYNLRERDYSGNGRHRHGNFKQGAGEFSPEEFTAFLGSAIASVATYLVPGALIYAFMDWKHVRELLGAADANGLELLNICIWDKGRGGMGSFYRSAHEMVFVFRHGDARHNNRIQLGRHGRDRTNLWRYEGFNSFGRGRDRALAMHGTVKPVQMICDLLLDCTEKDDIVFDGFGGSGTTLIAAQKLGRRARLVELDPVYCDTIIDRYRTAFGAEPVHAETGLSFREVAGLRAAEGASR